MEHKFLVNGASINEKSGENISIVVKIIKVERDGNSILAETTDEHQVKIMLSTPMNTPISGWVEAIGVSAGNNTVRCKEIIIFKDQDDELDTDAHNRAVLLWNNAKEVYQYQ